MAERAWARLLLLLTGHRGGRNPIENVRAPWVSRDTERHDRRDDSGGDCRDGGRLRAARSVGCFTSPPGERLFYKWGRLAGGISWCDEVNYSSSFAPTNTLTYFLARCLFLPLTSDRIQRRRRRRNSSKLRCRTGEKLRSSAFPSLSRGFSFPFLPLLQTVQHDRRGDQPCAVSPCALARIFLTISQAVYSETVVAVLNGMSAQETTCRVQSTGTDVYLSMRVISANPSMLAVSTYHVSGHSSSPGLVNVAIIPRYIFCRLFCSMQS